MACLALAWAGGDGVSARCRAVVETGMALRLVGDRTGALFVPVAACAAIISLPAWLASARAAQPGGRAAGAGMFLFVLSDLELAADRFGDVLSSPVDREVIQGTYWAAQGCIATSVGGRRAIA
ncbi:MAG: lysoplasmalogenase family protein [Gemmatimonadota bacterium]